MGILGIAAREKVRVPQSDAARWTYFTLRLLKGQRLWGPVSLDHAMSNKEAGENIDMRSIKASFVGDGGVRILLGALSALLVATALPAAALANPMACRQIMAACQSAGFAPGAARQGIGLQAHCMTPSLSGMRYELS